MKGISRERFVRIIDAVCMTESSPARIKGTWHSRTCSQTTPLEVVLDAEEPHHGAAPLKIYGRTVYQCPECEGEKAI